MLKCHTQVVQVHLQPFWRNSLLKCVSQPKIAKNSLKLITLGVQRHSRTSTLTPIKSLSLLLVMTSSITVPICNRFHATQDNCGKITIFRRKPSLTPACASLLKRRGSGLGLLKSTFNAENIICRLSWSISSHFVAIQC